LLQYAEAIRALRRLGLVKTNRHALTGDLAECIACRALGLTPASSKANPGFDATDREGRTWEIKGATQADTFIGLRGRPRARRLPARGWVRDPEPVLAGFDMFCGVLFTDRTTYDVAAIITAPIEELRKRVHQTSGSIWLPVNRALLTADWLTVVWKAS
jgi:hypothetical protein